MRIISSAEFRDNMKTYLDLASTEQIIIQRGKNETFEIVKRDYKKPDADYYRSISADEFRRLMHESIDRMYELPR